MRGIVIADQVDMLFLGDGLVDQAEKLQPLLMPVSLLAEAEDLAVQGVQSRKQRRRAVTFIVMRRRLATTASLDFKKHGPAASSCRTPPP
jgi:hypothetical protein